MFVINNNINHKLHRYILIFLYIILCSSLFININISAHRSSNLNIAKLQLEKLIQWCKENGAFVSDKISFEINCYGGEYTTNVVVTKPIKFGERVLKIPKSIFYTFNKENSIVWKMIEDLNNEDFTNIMEQQPQVIMALDLLIREDQNDEEIKNPYLDFLPKFVYGILDWTNETAELSSHFNIVEKMKKRNQTAINLFNIITKILVNPGHVDNNNKNNNNNNNNKIMMRKATFKEKFTYENFKRAWVTITSHSHGSISMRESIDTRKLVVVNTSLVPIADLFAHDSSENICLKKFEGYEMENGAKVKDAGFVVTASKDFKIGETFYVCYGHVPNANLLLNYGFAIEKNRFNRLSISASMQSPLKNRRDQLIKELNLPLVFPLSLKNIEISSKYLTLGKQALRIGQLSLDDLIVLFEKKKKYLAEYEKKYFMNHVDDGEQSSLPPIFKMSKDGKTKLYNKSIVNEFRDNIVQPYAKERIDDGLLYSSIIAQTSIFEHFRFRNNDTELLNQLQNEALDQSACAIEDVNDPIKLNAKKAALNVNALILKLSRQNLAKEIGEIYLAKFFKFHKYDENPKLKNVNKTVLKNLIYQTTVNKFDKDDVQGNEIKSRKGHLFIEAIRGMIYDKDGNLDQRPSLFSTQSQQQLQQRRQRRIGIVGRKGVINGNVNNDLPIDDSDETVKYVANFDGTVTVIWGDTRTTNRKTRVFRNRQDAFSFVNRPSTTLQQQQQQHQFYHYQPQQQQWNGYNYNYNSNYGYGYNSPNNNQANYGYPYNNNNNNNNNQQPSSRIRTTNYGGMHTTNNNKKNDKKNKKQKTPVKTTSEQKNDDSSSTRKQTIDSNTRDMLNGAVQDILNNYKVYDKKSTLPNGVSQEDMEILERTIKDKAFAKKFTDSFFNRFEASVQGVMEKKVFDIVRNKFYVPEGLGD